MAKAELAKLAEVRKRREAAAKKRQQELESLFFFSFPFCIHFTNSHFSPEQEKLKQKVQSERDKTLGRNNF